MSSLRTSKRAESYILIWRLFVLALLSAFFISLSIEQPWRKSFDDPEIIRFDSAHLQLKTADTGLLIDRDINLPDQWRANSPRSFLKKYLVSFERADIEAETLALFVPFAQDQVTLRVNGNEVSAHNFVRARSQWLWNTPLIFRFANNSLIKGSNTLELELKSTGSSRISLGKVYLGPIKKMDALYSFNRQLQLATPFAICVLLGLASIAFAVYAHLGGKLFWLAAGFNFSAALSLLNWLLATPPFDPHVWFAVVTFFEYVALTFMTVFMFLYLKLQNWMLMGVGIFILPILSLSLGAGFMGDMDSTLNLLESAEVAWGIGGLVLSGVVVWCFFNHSDVDSQAILWGVVLLIAFGLRDVFVHLGVLPATLGLHIPVGFLMVTLSMMFVALRTAIRNASALESVRLESASRVAEHSRGIDELIMKQSGLELTAIAGRLSQIYSHELRNPIASSLASGNLALKQLNSEHDPLHREAQRIVTSAMACSELLNQILATEKGLFPDESQVPLMMPEWLIAHSEDLSIAIGSRLTVGDSMSVNILAQPRSFLQALGLLLSDICVHQSKSCTVTTVVNCIGERAQLMFFFSQPVPVGEDGSDWKDWPANIKSAQALLSVDNARLEVLYNEQGMVYACLIEAESVPARESDVDKQVVC